MREGRPGELVAKRRGQRQRAHQEWLTVACCPARLSAGAGAGVSKRVLFVVVFCLPLAEHWNYDDALSGDRLLSRLSAKEVLYCSRVASPLEP